MQTKLDIHDFWVKQTKGSKQAVWLRSHVRLSRNLNGFPFSDQATPEQKNKVVEQIQKALQDLPKFSKDFVSFDWNKCSEHERSLSSGKSEYHFSPVAGFTESGPVVP